jgi:hypothetical protein
LSTKISDPAMIDSAALLAAGYAVKIAPRPDDLGGGCTGDLAPLPNHVGWAGSESAVTAYVDGLNGAERKVLVNHIARAWPEVVEAGVELVAQWRAESAELRRKALRRREHDRRARRRAELGDG